MKRYANMRLLAAVALLIAAAGCKDDEGLTLGQPALLSIQDATADAEVITVESPKKQTLDIRVEAEQISGNYITVVFKTAPELVGTYNAAQGTSYKLCPSEAYEFSTTEVMLPRYNTLSSTMKVELFSERMPDEEPYLLPITIDSIKGDSQATVSPTGSVRYILFNKLVKPGPPAPVLLERSGWKVLAAPKAKPNYEVEKMFDEDINTFGYCNADEEQANPPYDFVIDLGKEVTVRGFQFNQRYMTTGKPEDGARYGIAHLEVWTAKEIAGDGLGAANDANWTYTQTYRDNRTDPDSPLDPMGVVISPMLDDYQHARYVRLRIHASYTNKTYNPTFRGWCIAELNVWGNNELLE